VTFINLGTRTLVGEVEKLDREKLDEIKVNESNEIRVHKLRRSRLEKM